MAQRPKNQPVVEPQALTQANHEAAKAHLQEVYVNYLDETMGHLNNRIIAYIAESRLPLPQALLVIRMVEAQLIKQAENKYLGVG